MKPQLRVSAVQPTPALEAAQTRDDAQMTESLSEIQRLLQEIAGLLSSGTKANERKAVAKFERVAALASTSALTLQTRR